MERLSAWAAQVERFSLIRATNMDSIPTMGQLIQSHLQSLDTSITGRLLGVFQQLTPGHGRQP